MDQKKIGRFIKELRNEKGLTQEQLSEVFGVTNRSVSRWENGVNMPDFDLVVGLARYLGVDIEELLNGERKTEKEDAGKEGLEKETEQGGKQEMTDGEKEETLLKVADYTQEGQMCVTKRMNRIFILGIAAFVVYMVLEIQGLATTGIYEDIASFALGLVLGILIVGVLYTSRYMGRIRAFKMRLFHRLNRSPSSRQ